MPTFKEMADAVRFLSMDAVQKANSGHPGAPLGMADAACVLWNGFLRHNPKNPNWPDRDRFVLSNGHASMLLYSVLHLSGYDLSIDDIRNFRVFGSRTPGHPETGLTPGVETSTGPLGQGLANAVGMAMAEKLLAQRFNKEDLVIVDHFTYVFLGDGCMMEGISHEACSLAGTLGLGKLVAIYDDNGISIDGLVDGWFRDDTPARFEAYGWEVIRDVDGHDPDAVSAAIAKARSQVAKPTLICCKTVIGQGAPNACGSHECHGSPLGGKEIEAARNLASWNYGPFEIPAEMYAAWDATGKGAAFEAEWKDNFKKYMVRFPDDAAEFQRRVCGDLPENFNDRANEFIFSTAANQKDYATRQASLQCLNAFGPLLPELIGGSADLTPSNCTFRADSKAVRADSWDGNYINFGVREFAMAAIMNGLTLHGGFIPYGGTFLVFSDYARSAMRSAALMDKRSIFVLTHDSIGVGEDGPTHQPVEHVSSLRMIPGMSVWRPCDLTETAVAWKAAILRSCGPTSLILSRQNLKMQKRESADVAAVSRGGYILKDCEGACEAVILASGSEVQLAVQAADMLNSQGRRIRVVSMPCMDVFDKQDEEYKSRVLPAEVRARVAVEAGVGAMWYKYVGLDGMVIGMESFGASAPAGVLFEHFGFTVDNVIQAVRSSLASQDGFRST